MTHTKPLEIILLGDPGTGKTNLLSRFTCNHFNPKYEPTNGINFDSYAVLVGHQKMELDLFDLAGHKKWRRLADRHLREADGILLVYDISNPATFENLTAWLRLIHQMAPPKTVIKLVGNKSDLQDRAVPIKKAKQFATDNGLSYIETSALNNRNVHVVLDSIAQEIDAAMHLSETSKVPSGHDDEQQDRPFQVALIDIEQAARNNDIVCVEKPLDEANLEFIAISYRWGEVKEQVIDTKIGYMASITSFGLKDFYLLCRDMMKETDLQSIKYVWVDAICVDQNNQARRKATIYQMSNIYHRAAYILAVPDLHLKYLWDANIFDRKLAINALNFNAFIYYLLHEKTDKLVQIAENWFDTMSIPKDKMARDILTKHPRRNFTDRIQMFKIQDPDSPCHNSCSDSSAHYCHNTQITLLEYIQDKINDCHHHPGNVTMVYDNSDCALCSLSMYICNHQKNVLDKNKPIPDSNQKWLASVLKEFHYDKWRKLITERSQAVGDLMKYLQSLIKDWSSRVWVISEYNIAKSKQSRKMKFWFLSLYTMFQLPKKLDFFVFDFDKTEKKNLHSRHIPMNDVIATALNNQEEFQETIISHLNEKSFLKMMLDSKASRNEDRFYAIFPSSEYKNMLASREVVSSWQIDNMVSVKLKLYELMTTKHKLELLCLTGRKLDSWNSTFPIFANSNVDISSATPVKELNKDGLPCNFDLNNNATLRLVLPDVSPENKNGSHFYKLCLSPKMYYVLLPDGVGEVKAMLDEFFNSSEKLWKTLEINNVDDELVLVSIPIYVYNINSPDKAKYIERISLFGSFKESKWLIWDEFSLQFYYRLYSDKKGPYGRYPWKRYDNSNGNTSFDIY